MTSQRVMIALGCWAILLAAACQRAAPPPPDAVASIGDSEVRYAEFERYVARTVGDPGGVLGSDVLSELFDQFLDERLLERLAADRGLLRSSAEPGQGRQAIDALLEKDLRQQPGDAEIARYYQEHRRDFARPERVRLRQILTASRKAAEEARSQIVAGTPFEEVARRLSRGPRADGGGVQGELARSDLPPTFADLIFSLKPGEVSPVVPAEYGFHLFQVIEREPAEVVPLAAARGEILGRLRQQRADQLLRSLVQDARSHYDVKVYERNLPFAYQGSYSHAQKAR
ncbi:MAG TPA: peptidylprolyl isomerase [Thermoanaerobaculia bacterium]